MLKCWSGGQIGTDENAWIAAKQCGIETGGWMTKEFRTQKGKRPDFAKLYGAKEHTSYYYSDRTDANVRDSDATLIISTNWESPGTKCTLRAIGKYKKPYMKVYPNQTTPQDVANWLVELGIATLNVAGNSENSSPGIGEFARLFLIEVFNLVLSSKMSGEHAINSGPTAAPA